MDLPRTPLYIGDECIMDTKTYKDRLGRIEESYTTIKDKHNKYHMYSVYGLITMLCNQSSFAFPYILLNEIYGDNKRMLVSMSENRSIHISFDDCVSIILNATFGIRNIDTDVIEKKVKVKLNIQTNIIRDPSSKYSIKDGQTVFCKYGFISWQLVAY